MAVVATAAGRHAPPPSDPGSSLRAAVSRLWVDHITWTRAYVVYATSRRSIAEYLTLLAAMVVRFVAVPLGAVISRLGVANAGAVRLMRNQHDIGRAIVPFYGDRAGARLRRLLKQHITIAVKMISAARHGHARRFSRLEASWRRNAEHIARLLSSANSAWSQADVADLLRQHLLLTAHEVDARINGRWADDVDFVDQIYTEILTLAGVLSDGIIKQFPERFGGAPVSPAVESLTAAMRRLWSDHVIWTRQYIVATLGGTPDAAAAAARLLKNQEDIGHAVAAYYGEDAGVELTRLLKEHVTIAVDLIDAVMKSDTLRLQQANQRWDRNAADIAVFLSTANPNWRTSDLLDLLTQHLNLTRDELTAHRRHHWVDDVRAFDLIQTEILTVADALSAGIVQQFPQRF
jgi:hypothetical protein